MSNVHEFSEKKKILIKYKERLQNEINGVEQSIRDVKSELSRKNNNFEDYSLDSDTEVLFKPAGVSSVNERQLKRQQTALRIRLHATEELTNLKVLQSEVNVMVEPPTFEREPPVPEAGTWREVTADCRIDLVPFLITFYVHQPHRKFAARSYRGLRVSPVKAAHERELRRCLLPRLARPAHALEVIRNYAAAHRSRRSSLARLAELYADTLHMELEPECGYLLRFAGMFSMRWTLVNEWSPVAPFHHSLKFDFEYLDEHYVKRLMQTHKRLSDPRIETDERTALLAEMMDVCLEARGPGDVTSDDVTSDRDVASSRRRRQSILDGDDDTDSPPPVKKPKDNEVMAPPQTVPKRKKPRGKENSDDRGNYKEPQPRGFKRTSPNSAGGEGAKKAKVAKEIGSDEKVVSADKTKAAADVTEREKTAPAEKGAVSKIVEKSKNLNVPAEKEEMTVPKKMKPVAEESEKTKKMTVAEKSRPVEKVIVESKNVPEITPTAKDTKPAAKVSDKKQNALTKTSVKAVSAEKNKFAAKVCSQDQNMVSKITENAATAEKINTVAKVNEKNQNTVAKTTAKLVSAEKTKLADKVRAQNQNVASDVANSAEKNKLAVKSSIKNKKPVTKTTSKTDSVEKNVLKPKVNEKDHTVVSKISENVVSVEKTKSAAKVNEKTKPSAIGDHKNVANTIDKEKMTVAEKANTTFNVVEKNQNATDKEITKTVEKTISTVGLSKKANSTPNVEIKTKIVDKLKHNVKNTANVPTKKTSAIFGTNIKAKPPQRGVAASKSVANTNKKSENPKTANSAEIFRKSINKALVDSVKNSSSTQLNNKQPIKSKIPSIASIKSSRAGNTPLSSVGRAAPQSGKERVVSKIPQKKYSTPVFGKQNPVRISPRRLPSLKPGSAASGSKLAGPSWSSPRQLKKPQQKSTT